MSQEVIIVDKEELKEIFGRAQIPIYTTYEYLSSESLKKMKSLKIYNLSSSLEYQGVGYYVSLLASARKHKVFPDVTIIQDLKSIVMQKIYSSELEELVQRKLSGLKGDSFELSVYFGMNLAKTYEDLCLKLFSFIKAPLFRVYFKRTDKWYIKSIKLLSLQNLPESHLDFLTNSAKEYFEKKMIFHNNHKNYLYDLAILYNPEEVEPPSNKKALEKFVKVGRKLGLRVDLLTKKDINKILEYDALFIRETTNVNHHTYRIARMAEAEGLVVIDDPESILKCTNKVFLEESLDNAGIRRPKSYISLRGNYKDLSLELKYPCVIKQPDSAFSLGVFKAKSREEFCALCEDLFKQSELLLVQEYLPTDFDWRVGVIGNEVLFVCKYYMVSGHWKIYKTDGEKMEEGNFDTLDEKDVPPEVLKTAVKASKLIGSGLYGIDLKEFKNKVYVIEINDNPNVDYGIEDQVCKDVIYKRIMEHFIEKLNKQRKIFETKHRE